MGDELSVDTGRLRELGADFRVSGERLDAIAAHDSVEQVAGGLPCAEAGQACASGAAAAGAALRSVADRYQAMGDRADRNADGYDRTDNADSRAIESAGGGL